jgi:hypothetical protein
MNSIKGCFLTVFFGIFFVMFGPLLFGLGGYSLYRAHAFYESGEQLEGEVVEIVQETRAHPESDVNDEVTVYCPVVRFTAPGTSQSYDDKTQCNRSRDALPEVGETVSVVVEKGKPDMAKRGSIQSVIRNRVLGGLFMLVFGGGISILAPFLYWTGVLEEWMGN